MSIVSEIYESIGAASMCWSGTPVGTFDEKRAIELARHLAHLFDIHVVGAHWSVFAMQWPAVTYAAIVGRE